MTLDPGTVLQFDSGRGIRIEGTILARGTSGSPVVMQGLNGGSWSGIVFENAADPGSQFENLVVENSVHGIFLNSPKVTIKNSRILRPEIEGLTITDLSGPLVDLGNLEIFDSLGDGIKILNQENPIEIRNVKIENSARHGIFLVNPVINVILRDIQLIRNQDHGIHIDQMTANFDQKLTKIDQKLTKSKNSIEIRRIFIANQKTGVGIFLTARDFQTVVISDSVFQNNSAPSIFLQLVCNYSGNFPPVPPPFLFAKNLLKNNSNLVAEISLKFCTNANFSENKFYQNNPDRGYGALRLDIEPAKEYGPKSFRIDLNSNEFQGNQGEYTVDCRI